MNAFPRAVVVGDDVICCSCGITFTETAGDLLHIVTAICCDACGGWNAIPIETELGDEDA